MGLLVHASLRARVLSDSGGIYCGKPEYILIEVSIPNRSKILAYVIYRPPYVGYLSEFEDVFLQYSTLYQHFIIVGDFNSDLKIVSHDSTYIRNFVEASNLYLVPYRPTHHVRGASTLLDLCIINDVNKVVAYGQLAVLFLSVHDLIYVNYQIAVDRLPPREFT